MKIVNHRNTIIFVSLLCLVMGTVFVACSSDDDDPDKVTAERKGTFTDPRDGQQYGYVTYAGLDWMAENARYDIKDDVNSSIYLDADESGFTSNMNAASTRNLQRYGRLYTLEGAKAACPDGWRLPTDEDWQRLEITLGMSASEAAEEDWRGNVAKSMLSIYQDSSDLNLLLGGYFFLHAGVSGSWRFMGTYGYYWTSTADKNKVGEYYYVRKLTYTKSAVCRMSMEPTSYKLSVRYVRNAQ